MAHRSDYLYKDDSIIIGLLAPRGVGKTLLLTALAHDEWRKANNLGTKAGDTFRIFHNGFINEDWGGWKVNGVKTDRIVNISLEDILHCVDAGDSSISNGLILIDEISSIQDNRYSSAAIGGILFSHFIIMIRKQGCSIMWAGQMENTIDNRLKSQCDIVGYPVSAKKDRGRQVGVSWVYQGGTYTYPGYRRKMLYKQLWKFWDAYDTFKMIKSESISKGELFEKKLEIQQDEMFDQIIKHLEKTKSTTITLMEVKQILQKKLKIDWDLKTINENISMMAVPVDKTTFDFSHYAQ